MTRRERAYVETVAWVIGAARRMSEHDFPHGTPEWGSMFALRRALAAFDRVAKADDPRTNAAATRGQPAAAESKGRPEATGNQSVTEREP